MASAYNTWNKVEKNIEKEFFRNLWKKLQNYVRAGVDLISRIKQIKLSTIQ